MAPIVSARSANSIAETWIQQAGGGKCDTSASTDYRETPGNTSRRKFIGAPLDAPMMIDLEATLRFFNSAK